MPFRHFFAAAFGVTFLATTLISQTEKPPNIVIVMTDDQGFGDLGVHGNTAIETPSLDRFAKHSLGMERFYVNPLCSPTRASLMTGRYHLRTGILHTSRGAAKMRGEEATIAELLSEAGYRTGIFGKWHLGDNFPMRPQDQGFQKSLIHKSGGIGQTPDTDADYFNPMLWKNGQGFRASGYCTDLFFDGALRFVEEAADAPFFLYIAPNVPHTPLEVERSYLERFTNRGMDGKTAAIYGMLKNFDENFGRLLDRLDEQGIAERTLVIFMSDNGPTRGRYNAGLRGAKASVYEGGIRVPFYVRWPNRLPSGRSIDRIAAHIDVLPTLLQIAGIEPPRSLEIDGVSLWPLWSGEVNENDWPERVLFTQHIKSIIQTPFQNAAVITQRFKLVSYPDTANEPLFQPDYKNLDLALFDLKEDPRETNDLSESHPEILERLKRKYSQWFEAMKMANGFRPGVIHIGSPRENPTILCRYQDGHRPYGTDPEPIGWPVRIPATGDYLVSVRDTRDLDREAKAIVVKWRDKIKRRSDGVSTRFIELELEAGQGTLDVWLEDGSGNRLPRDFDVLIERR